MQIILFFAIFSRGFAQEMSLQDSEDNILLAANVKKLPSAEKNYVPNPYIDCVNVEEILIELNAERAKNRDLNQTISDILEEMEDIKKNIMRNEEKITDNQSSVVLLTKDFEDLQEEVDGVQGDVAAVQSDVAEVQSDVAEVQSDVAEVRGDVAAVQDDVVAVANDVGRNFADITTLGTRGIWCAFKYGPWTTGGTITYDSITFADSNLDITEIPLNIETGIFTVPISGDWRVSYSVQSKVYSGEENYARLFLKGHLLGPETQFYTFSESGAVYITGGRVVTLEANAGDTIHFGATKMDGEFRLIDYCAEYITKM